jgi:simple sugar transport system permease protein
MKRRLKEAGLQLAVAAAAVALALGVGAAMIGARGHNPFAVYGVLFSETLGDPLGLGAVLFKGTTLIFTGLAAAFAFRAGMFNIGGEGQLVAGAFACALAGLWLPAGTPAAVAVPVLLAAAFAGGAVAAAPPAVLKAARGTHEVINTMMMNFIVLGVVYWWLGRIQVPGGFVKTHDILEGGRLPLFSRLIDAMRGTDANAALLLAMAACAAAWWILERTRLGYDLRAVGLSPKAAEYGGVSVPSAMVLSLVVSGGVAGLGGVNFVMGSQGYFERDFAPGQGFLGIAVALLARNHPVGVIPAALLFAVLSEGGQTIQKFVPKQIGEILQAVVIVFVVVGAKVLGEALLRAQQRRVQGA